MAFPRVRSWDPPTPESLYRFGGVPGPRKIDLSKIRPAFPRPYQSALRALPLGLTEKPCFLGSRDRAFGSPKWGHFGPLLTLPELTLRRVVNGPFWGSISSTFRGLFCEQNRGGFWPPKVSLKSDTFAPQKVSLKSELLIPSKYPS